MEKDKQNRNFIFSIVILFSVFFFLATLTSNTYGQSRSERKQQLIEESGKVKSVKGGGQVINVDLAYDDVYEKLLNFLKKKDETIELANRETGQIASAISIEGGWKQTGTRAQFTLIKEAEKSTTVKVQMTEMQRYKALQVEPWDDPVLNKEKTIKLAEEVKVFLGAK